ncbi:Protein of unknown function [Cotesia congregata]|uniref:Uncharacterized protein n=1 Tax=Cotesia congregata TaxID=51543 RepID=A0A8J2HD68_COTCN|nr:Protein of unknown function [Cotesia congregata]
MSGIFAEVGHFFVDVGHFLEGGHFVEVSHFVFCGCQPFCFLWKAAILIIRGRLPFCLFVEVQILDDFAMDYNLYYSAITASTNSYRAKKVMAQFCRKMSDSNYSLSATQSDLKCVS